ncbi:MAG: hypothetical protein ROR55_20180 [Devosia sp.]
MSLTDMTSLDCKVAMSASVHICADFRGRFEVGQCVFRRQSPDVVSGPSGEDAEGDGDVSPSSDSAFPKMASSFSSVIADQLAG